MLARALEDSSSPQAHVTDPQSSVVQVIVRVTRTSRVFSLAFPAARSAPILRDNDEGLETLNPRLLTISHLYPSRQISIGDSMAFRANRRQSLRRHA